MAKRKPALIVGAVAVVVACAVAFAVLRSSSSGTHISPPHRVPGAGPAPMRFTCVTPAGVADSNPAPTPQPCPSSADRIMPLAAASAAPAVAKCAGVAMTSGQADIDANPPGTTFCLSGTHNWTLSPKQDDRLVGPAVLDGEAKTHVAVLAVGPTNVVLANLEIRNYRVANQEGAVQAGGGWTLENLQVHDNGTVGKTGVAGGYGVGVGTDVHILGGRYYNNRQGGLNGGGATRAVVDGAEIDHNNFTDDSYTTQNIDCNYDAGGMKLTANNVTVVNSAIHDNACRGLSTDAGAAGTVFRDNHVYDNWDEGILVEISGRTTITGNTITGNGFHTQRAELDTAAQSRNNGCFWAFGSGILVVNSGQTHTSAGNIEISRNKVAGNCNGISAQETERTDPDICGGGKAAPLCELRHLRIDHNVIAGSTDSRAVNKVGYSNPDGADLTTHDIVFGPNNDIAGVDNCQFDCP